jgi:hypothetical protein
MSSRRALRSVGEMALVRRLAAQGKSGKEPIERLRRQWEAAFPQLENRAWPERMTRAGVATIACTDASWAQELSGQVDALMEGLGEVADPVPVTKLRFVVGDRPAASGTPPAAVPSTRPPRVLASAAAVARDATREVRDPALRAHLERLVGLALSREERRASTGYAEPD